MRFEDQPFEEKVKLWFGRNPAAGINADLAPYQNGLSGMHLGNGNGVFNEPGEPPVGIAISRHPNNSVSWVRFHMMHANVGYVEEMHVSGWDLTRVAEQAQLWRRAVQRGEKEMQRVGQLEPKSRAQGSSG